MVILDGLPVYNVFTARAASRSVAAADPYVGRGGHRIAAAPDPRSPPAVGGQMRHPTHTYKRSSPIRFLKAEAGFCGNARDT